MKSRWEDSRFGVSLCSVGRVDLSNGQLYYKLCNLSSRKSTCSGEFAHALCCVLAPDSVVLREKLRGVFEHLVCDLLTAESFICLLVHVCAISETVDDWLGDKKNMRFFLKCDGFLTMFPWISMAASQHVVVAVIRAF